MWKTGGLKAPAYQELYKLKMEKSLRLFDGTANHLMCVYKNSFKKENTSE